jgi:hypothetical protein
MSTVFPQLCPTRTSRDVRSSAAIGGMADVWLPDQAKAVYEYTTWLARALIPKFASVC